MGKFPLTARWMQARQPSDPSIIIVVKCFKLWKVIMLERVAKEEFSFLLPNSKWNHDGFAAVWEHIVITQHSLSSHLSRAGLWALHWTQWGYVILIPNKSACSYLLRWLRKTIELRIPLIRLLNISWIVYMGDAFFQPWESIKTVLLFVILVAKVNYHFILINFSTL